MSAVIMACKIATGQIEEKYMDEEHRQTHQSNSCTLKATSYDKHR